MVVFYALTGKRHRSLVKFPGKRSRMVGMKTRFFLYFICLMGSISALANTCYSSRLVPGQIGEIHSESLMIFSWPDVDEVRPEVLINFYAQGKTKTVRLNLLCRNNSTPVECSF